MRPSFSDSRCSFPLFSMTRPLSGGLVIVDFVEDAAAPGGERPMVHARRTAGVGRCEALLAAAALSVVADDQVAVHYVDLFPVIVDEGLGGIGAGLDLEQPRTAALFMNLVEVAGQDLLVKAGRIARWAFPAGVEIDLDEFEMLLGLHQAPSSLPSTQGARNTSSCAIAWCTTLPS